MYRDPHQYLTHIPRIFRALGAGSFAARADRGVHQPPSRTGVAYDKPRLAKAFGHAEAPFGPARTQARSRRDIREELRRRGLLRPEPIEARQQRRIRFTGKPAPRDVHYEQQQHEKAALRQDSLECPALARMTLQYETDQEKQKIRTKPTLNSSYIALRPHMAVLGLGTEGSFP